MSNATQPADAYEFTAQQDKLLNSLASEMFRLAITMFAAGVLLLAYLGVQFAGVGAGLAGEGTRGLVNLVDYGIWGIISILVVGEGALTIRLVDPVRQITRTAGSDLKHLMEFVARLTALVRSSWMGAAVVSALLLLSIVLSVTLL